MGLRNLLKSCIFFLGWDLTKNLEYDRLTRFIMNRVIKVDSNCIDVGCHKGEILQNIIKLSPKGKHFAFEPIPLFFNKLTQDFANQVSIFPYALSDKNGQSGFQFVRNAPAYSGLKTRKYNIKKPNIKEIEVETRTLDNVIPDDIQINFIKIDVEGGEMGVLKGGKRLLKKYKPTIIFEFGKGAADFYGTRPSDLYKLLTDEIGLKVSSLKSFTRNNKPLTLQDFENYYRSNKEYYFIAHN